MARLIKDGSLRGQKAAAESVSKAPLKTLIILAKDFVQVSAKVLLHFLYLKLCSFNVVSNNWFNKLMCSFLMKIHNNLLQMIARRWS